MHQRQRIREAIKAALIGEAPDYATDAANKVYETQMVPWRQIELPAIAVYTLEESAEVRDASPRVLERVMTVNIEAVVEATENVDDAMDDLAQQIETAMHADETFGGVCGDSILTGTELEVGELGQKLVGLARLTYSVRYDSNVPEEAAIPDVFDSAEVAFNLGGEQHVDDRAVDELTDINQEE